MKRVVCVAWLLAGICTGVAAEEWSTTNIQYLYGSSFDRLPGEKIVSDGAMQTITIEHAGSWEYGRNFFFVDMMSGDFNNDKEQLIYGEWIPKLSLSKLSGSELSWGIVKELFLAGEINQGDDFRVYNLGAGVALELSGFEFFDLSLYHRKDNYNAATFQLAAAWKSSFRLASLPLVFEGFFDYYGTDYGTEIISHPRLLLDGSVFGESTKMLQAGVELYYYRSSAAPWRKEINEAVPQLMLKWVW
jgi:nucleoside-specific outer membrane channel protein Tsx